MEQLGRPGRAEPLVPRRDTVPCVHMRALQAVPKACCAPVPGLQRVDMGGRVCVLSAGGRHRLRGMYEGLGSRYSICTMTAAVRQHGEHLR